MQTTPLTTRGHLPTLIASFLHFDLSFMLWTLIGALGISISSELHLTPAQKGLLVALPVLSGSLLRLPMGLLADRIGGKRAGVGMLLFLFVPLTLGWRAGNSLTSIEAVGVMLGVAGASFAVALPLASRWYARERQGLVLGIAAAGNSGTVIANLVAPRLAAHIGWHNVLALAMAPLALVLLAFLLMARESPASALRPSLANYAAAFRQSDLWWLCFFYSVTFGGYVGLGSFLPIFFRDQYHVSPIMAGYLTAAVAFAGSGVRPLGGYLADRVGGARLLAALLFGIVAAYMLAAQLPPLATMGTIVLLGMICLGMGNGAVFQIVPQRFQREIGVATGLVGAIGGLGGFFLPILLGNIKQMNGSFGPGFVVLSLVALAALVALLTLTLVRAGWRSPTTAGLRLRMAEGSQDGA